jgi:Concanavalin A-like lectin/glucanases superfamily
MSAIINLLLAGAAKVKDAYFNLVMLLLNASTTTGLTNNTFQDSSSNNYLVTRNGSATQGTFTPFSPTGWSNYFGGSGNYAVSSAAVITTTTTTFTIEGWIHPTVAAISSGNVPAIIGDMQPTGATNAWSFGTLASGAVAFYWYDGAAKTAITNGTVSLNQWSHIAISVNANAISIFINGTLQTLTGTTTLTNRTQTTSTVAFGQWSSGTTNLYTGYISNFSVLSGTAKYSVAFTPTILPLSTSTTNQTLLFASGNNFSDLNTATTAKTFTITGAAAYVQAFSPFAPTSDYSTSLVGGSGYFASATSDYLTVSNAVPLQFGTGSYAISCWVYRSVAGVVHAIAGKGASGVGWTFQINASNQLVFIDTGTTLLTSIITIPSGVWTYVSVRRDTTGAVALYVNGNISGSTTSFTDFSQNNTLVIGADRLVSNFFNGFIAGFEYIKGQTEANALTISVPTLPPTTSNSPSLLLNFTNFGIYDATSRNNFITTGTAQSSTTQSQFGGSSIYFDGGSQLSYLYRTPFDTDISQLSAFTVECWVYLTQIAASGMAIIGTRGTGAAGFEFRVQATTGALQFYNTGGTTLTTTSTLTTGTWYYIAAVKNAGVVTMYINGVDAGGSGAIGAATASGFPLYIGAGNRAASYFPGYIDELRITRNVARDVTTVPIAPFPTQ